MAFKAAAVKVAAANALAAKGGDQQTKRIKYKADIERGVVITTFDRNGWSRTEGDDWSVGWFNVGNIRAMFHPDSGVRLGDHQMVNHYPNHWELTRKVRGHIALARKGARRYRAS